MEFKHWIQRIDETTLPELYQSTVAAFPRTGKRQHSTDLIRITEMNWTPYLGVKTLFLKGLAQSGESGKEYSPIVVFKGVQYHNNPSPDLVEIVASNGQHYLLDRLKYDQNEVIVRCNCPDFKWRFNYYDHLDKALFGRKRAKYEATTGRPPANPSEMPGMCKHLIKFVRVIQQSGILEG
jgi:hypothetical protein